MWFQFIVADLSYQLSLCDASFRIFTGKQSQSDLLDLLWWALPLCTHHVTVGDDDDDDDGCCQSSSSCHSWWSRDDFIHSAGSAHSGRRHSTTLAAWKVKQTHVCPDSLLEAPTPPPSRWRKKRFHQQDGDHSAFWGQRTCSRNTSVSSLFIRFCSRQPDMEWAVNTSGLFRCMTIKVWIRSTSNVHKAC